LGPSTLVVNIESRYSISSLDIHPEYALAHAKSLPPAEFQILLALADGPKHGHGIKLDVRDRTDGGINMGPGTLYGAIKRLLRRDWIEDVTESIQQVEDERLRYYVATATGLEAARAEAFRMSMLLGIAQTKHLIG
jgi:DNA-binding PadR family transcriptional regulator